MRNTLALAFPVAGLLLCTLAAAPKGPDPEHTWDICWKGVDITVDDEAVLNAFMEKGACLGPCVDCEGKCCIPGGDSLILTQHDCTKMGGRFQWDKNAPCFAGGD